MKNNSRPRPKRVAGFILVVLALLLIPARSLVAQSQEPQKPTPEAEQLKERLLQLEQTVQQLKAQITSMQDAQKKHEVAFVNAVATAPGTTPAAGSGSGTGTGAGGSGSEAGRRSAHR